MCGLGIYQYEHIEPPFSEAKKHDPNKITLLCGSCHEKVTKGVWSKGKVIKANRNPFCKKSGFTSDFFDIEKPFGVNVGRLYFYNNEGGSLFNINGSSLLTLRLDQDGPPLLSGNFYDEKTNSTFKIIDNEWSGDINFWDIEARGSALIIRSRSGDIFLEIEARPPNVVSIKRINMSLGGNGIKTNESTGEIMVFSLSGTHIDVSSGLIITKGPLVINNDGYRIEGGSFVALGQDGVTLNALDFESLLKKESLKSI